MTQDEPVFGQGVGDDTFPDAQAVAGRTDQVRLRAERNPKGNGRVYRIAYTVSDGRDTCSDLKKVSVLRKQGETAVDDGNTQSWNLFTGAPLVP